LTSIILRHAPIEKMKDHERRESHENNLDRKIDDRKMTRANSQRGRIAITSDARRYSAAPAPFFCHQFFCPLFFGCDRLKKLHLRPFRN
jgi:hypothetical protein